MDRYVVIKYGKVLKKPYSELTWIEIFILIMLIEFVNELARNLRLWPDFQTFYHFIK